MTHQSPAREPLLELYDALAQHQLREAGAEVAAAIAHAVGTPLNVISGRAELIRHDPSNALAQVARIEEQVKKLATGLRQLVDYLAVPDPRVAQRSASPPGKQRSSSEGSSAREGAASRTGQAASADAVAPAEFAVVGAQSVLDDVVALTEALARASHVEVVADGSGLEHARVERWHALGTLGTLVSQAIRHCANGQASNNGHGAPKHVRISGGVASQGVVFELLVPGLSLMEGWQLEHFQARPAPADVTEFYRTLSICAAVVRGHGGKLLVESAPNAPAIVVRFSCVNEPS
ncbi:MAG TPA: hypothetical protein VMG12_44660 [Polyangiaceae bacterium]|nr:hypothetical protein [Polyangiaceae bacterium]